MVTSSVLPGVWDAAGDSAPGEPEAREPEPVSQVRRFVPSTADDVHRRHGEFVWRVLHRLGVRAPIHEDVYQEVFVVVHRRLHTFNGQSALTTWLYEICLRVASSYRRKAHFQREALIGDWAEVEETQLPISSGDTPEQHVRRARRRRQLEAILDAMPRLYRVVFVMYDIEELSTEEIANITSVATGTVYSRLHRARRHFERALNRLGPSSVE